MMVFKTIIEFIRFLLYFMYVKFGGKTKSGPAKPGERRPTVGLNPILFRTTHQTCEDCENPVSEYNHTHCYKHAVGNEITYHLSNPQIEYVVRYHPEFYWTLRYRVIL